MKHESLQDRQQGNSQHTLNAVGTGITIRHSESVITLPSGSSAEVVADLVRALNHHA